jgi:GT2 family glycosyltransferase
MTPAPYLSISIVNYNACSLLRDCLHSIYTHPAPFRTEVIVVDNASQDGSAAMVAGEFPAVVLIKNPDNRGFIRANNQGLRAAQGQYILSLNNDTVVPAGSLAKLVGFLEQHPQYGACGGKLINPTGGFQWQCRRSFPTPLVALTYFLRLRKIFPGVALFHRYILSDRDPDESLDVDALSGACFLVRRETLTQTAGMDEIYFMYGDDLDWSYRIRARGWKIRYCADAPIIHYGGLGGTQHNSYRMMYHFYEAMWIFYRRHYRAHYSPVVTALVWLGIWIKFGLHALQYALGIKKSVSRKK